MANTLSPIVANGQSVPKRRLGTKRLTFGRVLLSLAVILVTLITLFPFLYALTTSFKNKINSYDGSLIPWLQYQPTLANWQEEFGSGGPETWSALRNSAIIATGATIVATTLGALTGYGLARYKYGIGNRNLVSWFLSQRFLPPIATVIPFVLLFKTIGLIDNVFGLIIVNATFTLPFAVLILRDFFADFPQDLQDAALADGASQFGVFWRVALPLAAPALVAAIIICFAFSWNEFLFASVLALRNAKPYPLLVGGSDTVRGIQFGFVSTRLLIAVTLPVVLSLLVQRYIVRGLALGAVKG
ncbi:MAG: carbohydrate ABC transporter permease [Aggregatilineales bacterium]